MSYLAMVFFFSFWLVESKRKYVFWKGFMNFFAKQLKKQEEKKKSRRNV